MVMARSAEPAATTFVFVVEELLALFESEVSLLTVAVLLMVVPGAAPELTFTTSEKFCDWTVRLPFVQWTDPVPLGAGSVQVQPAGTEID